MESYEQILRRLAARSVRNIQFQLTSVTVQFEDGEECTEKFELPLRKFLITLQDVQFTRQERTPDCISAPLGYFKLLGWRSNEAVLFERDRIALLPKRYSLLSFIMSSCDEEYEALINLIFPSNAYPVVHDTLLRFEWKNTKHHEESFRQHCINTARLMEEFCQEKNLLQGTWNGITYARLVGFLHDVEKPFALRTVKNGSQLFTGHAQVGARLFYLRFQHEIPEPILLTMGIAIDSHMCYLRSDKESVVDKLRVNAVMHMYFPSLDVLPILECLHRADAMGKHPSLEEERPVYLPTSPIPYHKRNKIVIFLFGPSGSGKSTLATTLEPLLSLYGSVQHLERDKVLMEFALEGESYKECRQRVYNDPKLLKNSRRTG
ncbi:hypothetical protein AVEN_257712-1 [Araneus ventricosus]|uniref:HD domain-containing protein n=1 Tax=Araneus ventricosus TaxID=182803 RepID=A0A4Y2LEF9_ARAVE|nr:hypothetical protein AVEN_257712-1 [Araneus ventricosus]